MDAAHEIVMMINTLVHKQNKLKAKKKKKNLVAKDTS